MQFLIVAIFRDMDLVESLFKRFILSITPNIKIQRNHLISCSFAEGHFLPRSRFVGTRSSVRNVLFVLKLILASLATGGRNCCSLSRQHSSLYTGCLAPISRWHHKFGGKSQESFRGGFHRIWIKNLKIMYTSAMSNKSVSRSLRRTYLGNPRNYHSTLSQRFMYSVRLCLSLQQCAL